MDATRPDRLVQALRAGKTPVGQTPGPTVSLDDFFEGNDDIGSIGCNLMSHPGIDSFHRAFREIRSRGDVQGVFVEIKDLVDEHSWPFSDTVFVLTSMSRNDLAKLLTNLEPDEVGEFPAAAIPRDLPPLKPGMKILGIWWD